MKWQAGWLTVGHALDAPIRLHWSVPLGALLLGADTPGALVGFVVVVLVHECGHAVAVHWLRHRVLSIDVLPFGGECTWEARYPKPRDVALIAWGGVVAQAILLLVVSFGLPRPPPLSFAADLDEMLTRANALLILVNLVPIAPLDGARAWQLLPMLARDAWARVRP